MLESFTLESFTPLVGDTFRVDVQGTTFDLVLLEAVGLPAPGPGRRPFTLEFSNPRYVHVLPQAIYLFEHSRLGSFGLFIVPLGPEGGGMRYQAVFG